MLILVENTYIVSSKSKTHMMIDISKIDCGNTIPILTDFQYRPENQLVSALLTTGVID